MVFDLLQHVVVTIVAIGAAAVIVRRVAGVVRTPGGQPKCSSCPSAEAHGQSRKESPDARPLTLVRSGDRQ